jgi:hypothetical protein
MSCGRTSPQTRLTLAHLVRGWPYARTLGCAALCRLVCAWGYLDLKTSPAPRHTLSRTNFSTAALNPGVIADRFGNPTRRITQHLRFEDGRNQQWVWRLRRIDAHYYAATINNVVGIAMAQGYGNAFHQEYTLELKPGNFLLPVHFKHWMYLPGSAEAMMNWVTINKLGVIVAEVTEYFRRGAGSLSPARPSHRKPLGNGLLSLTD